MLPEDNRDLSGLRLFVQIAESGSLSKAAQELETSQPVISRRLAAVEKAWGGRLLHRTGRGVTLTEAGERALPKIQELLEAADMLADQIAKTKNLLSGVVRIAALPSIAYLILPKLLRHIRENQLDIRIEIMEGPNSQIERWHAEGRTDLSILYRYGSLRHNEVALATARACLVGCADDPLLDAKSIAFKQLHGLRLAMPPRPSMTRNTLDLASRRLGIDINVVIEPSSLTLLMLVAQQAGHYTILPRFAVVEQIESGRLKAAQISNPEVVTTIACTQPLGRSPSAATLEIFAFIRGAISEGIPG